jgi:hypothetical protein
MASATQSANQITDKNNVTQSIHWSHETKSQTNTGKLYTAYLAVRSEGWDKKYQKDF